MISVKPFKFIENFQNLKPKEPYLNSKIGKNHFGNHSKKLKILIKKLSIFA